MWGGAIQAQARQYHFTHLSIDNGLSHNDITDIVQDQNGFMWFATRDGINRFDGRKIKIYRHTLREGVPNGINFITSVCMDHSGTIWMGAKGISYYNAMADSLEVFSRKTKEGLSPQHTIKSIQADSRNWVYFLEEKQGIYCYKPETEEFLFYPFEYSRTANGNTPFQATALWIDADDRIWLGGDGGVLCTLNVTTGIYHAIEIDCLEFVNDQIQVIRGNGHFVYLGFQYSGVIRYDLEHKTFSPIGLVPSGETASVYVHDILIDNYSLWVATEKGLYIYDELKGTATHLKRDYFDPFSLSDDAVYVVYKDKEEGLWLGTYFGGINYLSLEQSRFVEKYYPLVNKPSISGKAVREIIKDGNGYIWIGTEDGGLNRFDPKTKTFHTYSVGQGLNYHNIHGLAVVGDHLYIGTYTAGLNVMNLKTGRIAHHYVSDEKYNVGNSIYSICPDRQGRIWIGTRSGVYWFAPQNGKFTTVGGLEKVFAHQVYEDSRGNVWIASINRGLLCCTPDNQIIDHRAVLKEKLGIEVDKILTVYEDSRKRLWLATSGFGLIRYDAAGGEAIHYSKSEGIPDDIVYKVVEDYDGGFWFGTNRGLVRLEPESGHVRVFTKNDGIICNQFNYSSAFRDDNGKLYFGTIEGLVVVDPSAIREDAEFPPVYLTGFEIHNKEVPVGGASPLSASITQADYLTLKYNQNTISFDFAVLRYAASQKNACYVMLEGFEKTWKLIGGDLKASYANLPPGKYKLRIQSSNSIGEWKEVRSLDIRISPPWWKSIVAYIIYSLMVVMLLTLLFINAKKKIEERQRLLIQKMEQEKERESYHAKIEFFTNIAHEIKTPLTLIKAPLEYIQDTKEFDKETTESLDTIMKNTERLLALTYQLLDFRRVEDKRLVLNFEQTDIVLLLSVTYDRFKLVAGQRNIHFSLQSAVPSLTVEVDVENLTKIISNLFNNALKYCNSYIGVKLNVAKDTCKIVVENDGEIIQTDMKERIFTPFVQLTSHSVLNSGQGLGLPLARSLAELHGGTLVLDASCMEYNRFILSLPIQHLDIDTLPAPPEERLTEDGAEEDTPKTSSTPTLLIVEDNLEMLDFVARKLIKTYHILRATDGVEALNVLNESDIDMVISDIMMPNMDGFELLKAIKSNTEFSHIPVILLTAKTNLQSKMEGLELGADAYVEKPFSLNYLQAQIQNILKNRAVVKDMFHNTPLAEANVVALTKADELFLQKLNELIEENLTNAQFGIDLLSEKLYMSRSSLHRKIKGLSDLTPNDYVRLHRLKKAALLLQEGELRINEIATITGFTSSSYFTKSFQHFFGMTPKEFVKSVRQ